MRPLCRVDGPSPSMPDCYDIDVELPMVPQPRTAEAVATPEADAQLAKVMGCSFV